MLDLQVAPYGYSQGDVIQVQVRSTNSYGDGPYSEPLKVPFKVRAKPAKMDQPTRDITTNPE